MTKKLVEDLIIIDDKVHTVILYDIDPTGTNKKYSINILDKNNSPIPSEKKEIVISLGAYSQLLLSISKPELYNYLIQFRKRLKNNIESGDLDQFTYPDWSNNKKKYEIGLLIESFFSEYPDSELKPNYIRNSITISFEEILRILDFYESNNVLKGFEIGSLSVTTRDNWFNSLSILLENLRLRLDNERINPDILYPQKGESVNMNNSVEYDFFICHASEDKDEIVEPLADALRKVKSKVWYDKWVLKIGDKLLKKIDEGLINSKYGIVILSKNFFNKEWPQKELEGLIQKEVNGRKVILPVWHKIDKEYLMTKSPTLAGRLAGNTNDGINKLTEDLLFAANIKNASIDLIINTTIQNVADVNIKFNNEQIGPYCDHHYSLIVKVKLLQPPTQGEFRFKFNWPHEIPILEKENLEPSGRNVVDGQIQYYEYEINWDKRIYPGETVEIIGTKSKYKLKYKFNNKIYNKVFIGKTMFNYTLFLEDHDPIEGSINFKKLNVF